MFRLRASIGVMLAFALFGRTLPVVLLRRKDELGRLMVVPVDVLFVVEDATAAALSLRLLSTCSIDGLGLLDRLFERTIGIGRIGELYSRDGSTLAEVAVKVVWAAGTLDTIGGATAAALG